ncbi:NepR family anti-sigma factor [uncultured Roseibium sp.]|uniref:NepR family anti-sigma factor n=1 Tax=uncultured Roseibium sp. TaxID=1936171 RepID=UPI0032180FAF
MNGSKKPADRSPSPQPTSGSFQKAQETITQKLREYYDSVEDEGIPDRFLDLLEKLDEAEKKAGKAAEEAGRK